MAGPLLEDVDEEPAVLPRADGAVGDEVALLAVERTGARTGSPAGLRERQQLGGHPLDDRDELDERGAELVAQEGVDLAAVVAVGGVDRGERVPVDAVALERVQPAYDAVEGGLATLVDAVGVVHLPRTVDRHARPGSRWRGGTRPTRRRCSVAFVCTVLRMRWPGRCVPALQLEGAPEEVEAHEGGLAALERDDDLVEPALSGEQLADVGLVHRRVHAEPAARVELLLGQEEAVLAVQVADRARRLGHDVERARGRAGGHSAARSSSSSSRGESA